jgi:hypothetical protein
VPRAERRPVLTTKNQTSRLLVPLAWSITVLSLATTLGTAAIQLGAQIRVSPQEPIERSQPFSIPFRIENTGYLPFDVDHVYCYARKIRIGTISIIGALERSDGWDSFTLNAGESKAIVFRFVEVPAPPDEADIAVVVEYKLAWGLLRPRRKIFRFTGARVDNWQWLPQPSGDIESEVNSAIDDFHKRSGK